MHYDHIESTIKPEEAQPDISLERSSAEPEAVGQRPEACLYLAFDSHPGVSGAPQSNPWRCPSQKEKADLLGPRTLIREHEKAIRTTHLHLWQLLCQPCIWHLNYPQGVSGASPKSMQQ